MNTDIFLIFSCSANSFSGFSLSVRAHQNGNDTLFFGGLALAAICGLAVVCIAVKIYFVRKRKKQAEEMAKINFIDQTSEWGDQ